jgi:hypothetical protein
MVKDRSYSKESTSLIDLRAAIAERLADAHCLLAGDRFASAIALGLYALEIALKTRICDRLDVDALPKPFEIHDLRELLILTGLGKRLADPSAVQVKANWDDLIIWQPQHVNELRYLPGHAITRQQAERLLFQLQDPSTGILSWLRGQP